jgi:hypothetical protein
MLPRHMFDFIIVTLALVALGPIDIPVKALRVQTHDMIADGAFMARQEKG